jgi:alpha/beta hydrolase fold
LAAGLIACSMIAACASSRHQARSQQDPQLAQLEQTVTHWAEGAPVLVNGHRLFTVCRGQGMPTVVLEAGLGVDSAPWEKVFERIAAFTRVCAYDRAWLGRSDPGPALGTIDSAVSDLRGIVSQLNGSQPVVVVGHSLGGTIVRAFADMDPLAVAAVVLIDSPPLSFDGVAATVLPGVLHPPPCGTDTNREHLDICLRSGLSDRIDRPGALGARPLTILIASERDWGPLISPSDANRLDDLQVRLQRQEQQLSSHSRWVMVSSSHFIQWYAPDVVVREIKHVIDQIRTPSG